MKQPATYPIATAQTIALPNKHHQPHTYAQLNILQRLALRYVSFKRVYLAVYLLLLLLQVLLALLLVILTGAYWLPNQRFQDKYIRFWCRMALGLMRINVEWVDLRGDNNQPLNLPALWVSNHVSWIDIIALQSRFALSFVTKAEVAKWPLIGSLARACGSIFIKRGSGDSSAKVIELARHVQAGRLGLFFPEGTTTTGQSISPFYPKLFGAAAIATVPIQPVVVEYVNTKTGQPHLQAPFVGEDDFINHIKTLMLSPAITVKVKLIDAINSDQHTAISLCDSAYKTMSQALNTTLKR